MNLDKKVSIMYDRLVSEPILKLREGNQYYSGVTYGIYYGYPDCCISDFTTRLNGDSYTPQTEAQQKAHHSTGFIPCPKCAEKIVSGEIKQGDLVKNRLCDYNFPEEGDCYASIEEMNDIEGRIYRMMFGGKAKRNKKQ